MFCLKSLRKINLIHKLIFIFLIFVVPSFVKADTTTGLVGHWTFDNLGSANYIQDMSGQGNHMYIPAVNATTSVSGIFGDAITLDGVNDYLTQAIGATTFSFEKNQAFSFSGWYSPGATLNPSEDANIASESFFGNTTHASPKRGYVFGFGGFGTCPGYFVSSQSDITSIGFTLWNTGGSRTMISGCTTPDDSILDAGWHHVAVTYDGSMTYEGMKIYVDGVSKTVSASTHTYNNNETTVSPSEMRLGDDGTNDFLDATIDDFRFYNRVLSQSDVTELYTGRPGVTTQAASSTSDTVSILNGTITSDGVASSTVRGFQYGTTSAYGATSSTSGTYGVGTYAQTITGLTPSTTYYARAFASSTEGVAYGDSITFRTRANVTNGLIGRWTFDTADVANNIADTSGQGNHGFLKNAATTTIAGQLGQAITLDGVNDYIELTNSVSTFDFEKTESFSFSGWFISNGQAGNSDSFFGNSQTSTGPGAFFGFKAAGLCDSWQKIGFLLVGSAASTYHDCTPDTPSLLSGWRHIVLTYDGNQTTSGAQIYIDGVVQTMSGAGIITGSSVSTLPMRLGDDGTNDYFDGSFDDFRFYNRVISPHQALSLYTGYYKPEVSTQSATDLTIEGATLNGTIVDDGAASSTIRGFQYGTTSAYGATSSTSGTYGTGAYTADITGLADNTLYHYRAFASSTEGIGYGSDITFTTVADLSIPSMTVQAASSVGTTTVTLNGTITSDGNASSTERGFNYGTTLSYGATSSTSGTYGVGTYSQNITGLTPNTLYHVRSYSINSQGMGSSTDTTFTTDPISAPSMTVQAASSITTTGATLNGTITSIGSTTVTTRGFAYGTSQPYTATSSTSGAYGTGAYTASISSLTCATTYHIASFATNEVGSTYSSDTTFITSDCDYTPAVSQDGADVSTSTATLYGNLDTAPVNSTEVGFVYGTTEGGPYEATSTQTGDFSVGAFQNDITGLDNVTTYYFKAYTYNEFEYAYSTEGSFETTRDPIIIEVADCTELEAADDDVYSYIDTIELTDNIDCVGVDFEPLWQNEYFEGTFDGQGYEIINLDISQGITSEVGLIKNLGSATIQDLGIRGSVYGDGSVGMLAGYTSSSMLSISNVHATGTVSDNGEGHSSIGGLIGYAELYDDTTISNSSFSGDVSGYSNVGGLIGYLYMEGDGDLNILDNTASGTVTSSADGDNANAGGLIGILELYTNDDISISRNHVNSDIDGGIGYYPGGLIGNLYLETYDTSSSLTVDQNFIEGSVSSDIEAAGGLIAYTALNDYASQPKENTFTISNNKVVADVSSSGDHVGGILGYLISDDSDYSTNTSYVSIINNLASSTISGNTYVGGIIGYIDTVVLDTLITNNTSVSNLSSSGVLTGVTFTVSSDRLTLSNNFFDSTKAGTSNCLSVDGTYSSTSGQCEAKSSSAYFKGESSVSPYSSWNFSTIWQASPSVYPLLSIFESGSEDTTDPVISDVSSTVEGVVDWTTDETTSSRVVYSTDTSYSTYSSLTDTFPKTLSHSVTLSSLSNCTTYNYKVVSGDANRNYATSTASSFTTGSCSSGGGSSSGSRTNVAKATPTPKPSTTPSVTTPSKSSFTRTLKPGDIGEDVRNLQKFLNTKGYTIATVGAGSPNNETTYFGPATLRALAEFQRANSLPPVGLLGPLTQALLNNTPTVPNTTPSTTTYTRNLELGSVGEDVRSLQKFLNSKGYTISSTGAGSPNNETTFFGPATVRALILFQKDNNISPAVGYFGPVTREKVR